MKRLLTITFSLCLFSAASATTIIQDTFTDTDGKQLGPDYNSFNQDPAISVASALNQHSPDINLTLNPYTFNNQYNSNPVTVQSGVGVFSAGAGSIAAINITSSASPLYSKPTVLTISADLQPNGITTAYDFDKVGLGFYSTLDPGQVFQGFLGLALSANGTVSLIGFPDADDFNTSVNAAQSYTLGTFDPNAFHTLTYTIDTSTGAILDASLTDAKGTENYTFSTNLFTDAATTYAAFYARSDSTPDVNPSINNFTLSGNLAAPEPSTFALLITGFGGLAFLAHRRRKLSLN